mmetsp:Transcript_19824/g.63763  ORF Transcript_19824/g.63763 Transcript_19824/m.63763 type:complete len:496 (+) Transcript_19824:88-1575(+)
MEDEDLLDRSLESGGPFVRGKARTVCRVWRKVADREAPWREWCERRWWHRVESDPGVAFGRKVAFEAELAGMCLDLPSDRQGVAVRFSETIAKSDVDARQFLVFLGARCGNAFCEAQLRGGGRHPLIRPPPTRDDAEAYLLTEEPFFFVRDNKMDFSADLGHLAASGLVAAMRKRAMAYDDDDEGNTLDAGFFALNEYLRVFFDSRGVDAVLTALAAEARELLLEEGRSQQGERDIVGAVEAVLYERHSFRGDAEHYYTPANSFLDDVVAREVGIPISLAMVFASVCERAALPKGTVAVLNTPCHVLLEETLFSSADESESERGGPSTSTKKPATTTTYLDVFDGKVRRLSKAEALAYLARAAQRWAQPDDRWLERPPPRAIVLRALRNLIVVYEGFRRANLHAYDLVLAVSAYEALSLRDGQRGADLLTIRINRLSVALTCDDNDVKWLLALIVDDYRNIRHLHGRHAIAHVLRDAQQCYDDYLAHYAPRCPNE